MDCVEIDRDALIRLLDNIQYRMSSIDADARRYRFLKSAAPKLILDVAYRVAPNSTSDDPDVLLDIGMESYGKSIEGEIEEFRDRWIDVES